MASKDNSPKDKSNTNNGSTGQTKQDGPKRKPNDKRENSFNFLAWAVEGATGIIEEIRHNDLGLSEEFWTHFYNARQESLFAARSFFDSLIEPSETEAAKKKERTTRKERRGGINIDF